MAVFSTTGQYSVPELVYRSVVGETIGLEVI